MGPGWKEGLRYLAKIGGIRHKVELQHMPRDLSISVDDERFLVYPLSFMGSACLSLMIGNRPYTLDIDKEDNDYLITINGKPIRVSLLSRRSISAGRSRRRERLEGLIKSRIAGRIARIDVSVGKRIEQGMRLLTVEAMKMENEIKASKAGMIKEIHVNEGDVIRPGDRLMEIE